MSNAKSTNPRTAMITAKIISATRVPVKRFCPTELQIWHSIIG